MREVDRHNGVLWTFGHALLAHLALGEIDVGEVVLHGDGLEGAHLGALAAADTGGLAVLHGHRTLLLVVARHIHAAVLGTFVANLDDGTRTGLGAHAAAHALLLIHHRQFRRWVDGDGSEVAGLHAVAAAETAVGTEAFAGVQTVGEEAGDLGVVAHLGGRVLARTLAAHYRHFRGAVGRLDAEDGGNLVVLLFRCSGTAASFHGAACHHRLRQVAAACKSASAAVGAGQQVANQVDAGVFLHMELLGNEE